MWKNKHLITKGTLLEWHYKNGTKQILNLHEPIFDDKKVEDCLLIGQIKGNNQSTAAIGKKRSTKNIELVLALRFSLDTGTE